MIHSNSIPSGLDYTSFSTSIPFVLCSSGSMGNNGALSAITAITSIYPQAYVYLPANAIVAGSAAGWYYAVFSSTTAATVYNNTYTSGVPTVPASPTAFVTTGPGAFTANNSGTMTLLSFTLPANSIGPTGRLFAEAATTQTNNANAKNMHFRVGGDAAMTFALNGAAFLNCTATIANRGTTGNQVCTGSGVGTASYSVAARIEAYDMTAAQTITVTMTAGTATDTCVLESFAFSVTP